MSDETKFILPQHCLDVLYARIHEYSYQLTVLDLSTFKSHDEFVAHYTGLQMAVKMLEELIDLSLLNRDTLNKTGEKL